MKSVKVHSTAASPYCVQVKRFLKDNNVDFEDIDVASDQQAAQEMIEKTGQMGVPVIDIEGEIISGFDQARIRSSLGI